MFFFAFEFKIINTDRQCYELYIYDNIENITTQLQTKLYDQNGVIYDMITNNIEMKIHIYDNKTLLRTFDLKHIISIETTDYTIRFSRERELNITDNDGDYVENNNNQFMEFVSELEFDNTKITDILLDLSEIPNIEEYNQDITEESFEIVLPEFPNNVLSYGCNFIN